MKAGQEWRMQMNLGADLEGCCEPQAWIAGEVVKAGW